jgi:hypothetical protein
MSGCIPPLPPMPSWPTQRKLYRVSFICSLCNDAFVKLESAVSNYSYRSE